MSPKNGYYDQNAVNERFILAVNATKTVSERKFGMEMGFNPTNFNQVMNRQRNPTVEMLVALSVFHGIRLDWLLKGEGGMRGGGTGGNLMPVFGLGDYPGGKGWEGVEGGGALAVEGLSDRAEYVCVKIPDDRMHPAFVAGDMVLCHRLRDLESPNYGVLIAGAENAAFIGNAVSDNTESGILTLRPSNPAYGPVRLRTNEIRQAWRVVMLITARTEGTSELAERLEVVERAYSALQVRLSALEGGK